jgi:hypothetical protein
MKIKRGATKVDEELRVPPAVVTTDFLRFGIGQCINMEKIVAHPRRKGE